MQRYKADAWLQEFYANFAEPYAKGSEDAVDAGNIMEDSTVFNKHPLRAVGIGARETDQKKVTVVSVDTVALEHIFDMHSSVNPGPFQAWLFQHQTANHVLAHPACGSR